MMNEMDKAGLETALLDDRWQTLLNVFRLVNVSLDLEEILHGILSAVRLLIEYDAGGIYVFDPPTKSLRGYQLVGYQPPLVEIGPKHCNKGIIGHVMETGRGVVVPDVTRDPHYFKARDETQSELAAPLIGSGGRTIGVINLESDTRDAYSEADLELSSVFASLVAIGIEKANLHHELLEKRRLESELRIARQVMEALMSDRAPSLKNFEIAGRSIPSAEVGGDYFDFIDVAGGRTGLVIADVSGKGIPAALIMATFRAYLHALLGNDFALRAVFTRLNNLLIESTEDRHFVTAFYGELDNEGRRMFYLNAGHNPPLLIRHGQATKLLSTGGVPLGVLVKATYSEDIVYFSPGDVLVLYTDGVTEAENGFGDPYGLHRLEKVIRRNLDVSAHDLCQVVVDDVRDYASPDARTDDLTLMMVRAL
jgi:sigma-B regulation protein RsbU (phosphoserine phosphatase)